MPIALRYERICFDRSAARLEAGVTAQLLAPGHALLDGVVDYTISRYREALDRGTVLVDRLDPTQEPRLMVALREEVVDGAERSVAKRFGYVELWGDGRARPGIAPFLDYAAPTEYEFVLVTDLLDVPWLAKARQTAELWAANEDLPPWYTAVSARRRAEVNRTRDLVGERLELEIQYWLGEAARLTSTQMMGGETREQPRTAEQRAADKRRQLERRLSELDQEAHTQVRPPVVAAVALVVPQGLLDRRAGRREDTVIETAGDLAAIERRAIHLVLEAERRLGRMPEVMAHNNPGYDVRSAGQDGHLVHIEVKGRVAGADDFFVTNREIRVGQNADNYRLALVEVDPDESARDSVRYVHDPFVELHVSALVTGVQFKWKDMWARGGDAF
jgi:hypothetical protein